jgi:hypothetical protein
VPRWRAHLQHRQISAPKFRDHWADDVSLSSDLLQIGATVRGDNLPIDELGNFPK